MTHWHCLITDYRYRSQNELQRMHYRTYAKVLMVDSMLVMAYGSPLPSFDCKVRVAIVRLWGKDKRALDDGNLAGGTKCILDAMKRRAKRAKVGLGIIVDDSPKWCSLSCHQLRNPDSDKGDLLILVCPAGDEFEQRWWWAIQ